MCFVCVVCVHVSECVCVCVFVCESLCGVIEACTLEKALGWKPCMSGSEIIATLSPLIVVGLGLCNVCFGLRGNSIHIQQLPCTHEF